MSTLISSYSSTLCDDNTVSSCDWHFEVKQSVPLRIKSLQTFIISCSPFTNYNELVELVKNNQLFAYSIISHSLSHHAPPNQCN